MIKRLRKRKNKTKETRKIVKIKKKRIKKYLIKIKLKTKTLGNKHKKIIYNKWKMNDNHNIYKNLIQILKKIYFLICLTINNFKL